MSACVCRLALIRDRVSLSSSLSSCHVCLVLFLFPPSSISRMLAAVLTHSPTLTLGRQELASLTHALTHSHTRAAAGAGAAASGQAAPPHS